MSTRDGTVLVTIRDYQDGYWYPRAFKPVELASYLQGRSECEPEEQFRLWEIDSEGVPRECEIESKSTGYDDNDYAHVAVRVVRKGTGKFVTGTGYRVDGRA